MKKSFKFLAILLALITSVSGLAPIGAVLPSKQSIESEEKSTERPQKRAREDEDSERSVQRKRIKREQKRELSEKEKIAQRLRERERIAHIKEDAINRARTKNLTKFNRFYIQKLRKGRYLSILSRCLIPRKQHVLEFKARNLHFTYHEIERAYPRIITELLFDTNKFFNDIKANIGANNLGCRTPSQLGALAMCIKLIISKDFYHLYTLERAHVLYLLSISKFIGDSDIPELDTDVPPEEFDVDKVSVRYMDGEMVISCYHKGKKVYESILGSQY